MFIPYKSNYKTIVPVIKKKVFGIVEPIGRQFTWLMSHPNLFHPPFSLGNVWLRMIIIRSYLISDLCFLVLLYCNNGTLVLNRYCIAYQRLVLFIIVKKNVKNQFLKSKLNTNIFVIGKERYKVTATGVYGVSLESL